METLSSQEQTVPNRRAALLHSSPPPDDSFVQRVPNHLRCLSLAHCILASSFRSTFLYLLPLLSSLPLEEHWLYTCGIAAFLSLHSPTGGVNWNQGPSVCQLCLRDLGSIKSEFYFWTPEPEASGPVVSSSIYASVCPFLVQILRTGKDALIDELHPGRS